MSDTPSLNFYRKWLHDFGGIEQEAGEALMARIDDLESALAAETKRANDAEAKLAQVQDWNVDVAGPYSEDLDVILAQSDTSAVDAVRADAAKQALLDAAEMILHKQHPESVRLMLRARAEQIGTRDGD